MTTDLTEATEHYREHGYVVLPGLLGPDLMGPVQRDLSQLFPTPDEFHAGVDPERNAALHAHPFAGIQRFPYRAVTWSLLGLSEPIVTLAETLLGTPEIRLYEAHNWAKYGGKVEYDQDHHRDFNNHTLVVPTPHEPSTDGLELFIYVHDVDEDCGPTYVVSNQQTAHIPLWPTHPPREAVSEIYDHEVPAIGPAGTVVAYSTTTFHRGSAMRSPTASRFVLKASYRPTSDLFESKLYLLDPIDGYHLGWLHLFESATPRQLELLGLPKRGHRYWTEETWAAVSQRYPTVDLTAFRPRVPARS